MASKASKASKKRHLTHKYGIDCGGPSASRCRIRQAPPAKFDKRSFRVITRGAQQITIGCPKGKWDAKRGKCKVGTRIQTVTYPLSDPHCKVCRR